MQAKICLKKFTEKTGHTFYIHYKFSLSVTVFRVLVSDRRKQNHYYYYYYYYLLQLSCVSSSYTSTDKTNKNIRVHKRNNTTTQYKQYKT